MADSGEVVRVLELETTVLGSEELKEKDCGAGVSNAENLSFRFSFTVGGEGAARLWGVGAGA